MSASESIRLLWPHILVEKDPLPKHVGQIELPQARAQRPVSGTILKVGPGLEDNYSIGDHVLFAEYAGHSFSIDGEEITLLSPSEILGIVTKEEASLAAS